MLHVARATATTSCSSAPTARRSNGPTGALDPLLGRRLGEIYPDRPEIAEDLALAFGERRTVRRELNFRFSRRPASSAGST